MGIPRRSRDFNSVSKDIARWFKKSRCLGLKLKLLVEFTVGLFRGYWVSQLGIKSACHSREVVSTKCGCIEPAGHGSNWK